MLPSRPPPPFSRCATDKEKPVHRGFMLLNPLPTKDENIPPVWGHSVTQTIYISPQTNEIAKSEGVWVALNKRTPVVEKGHQLLGVLGSGRQAVKQAANPDQQFLTNSTLFPPCHINLLNNCRKTQIILLRRPCEGKILTRNMALKQQHRTEEMVTNYTKMSWNCDRDKEKHKYNSIIPTATWLPPLSIHKTACFEIQT